MRKAFTLVELSIVLVILGLLVGGVLSGQALIRSAELRAVTTEFNAYRASLNTFKDKYFALPGDMPNATQYWGAQHATPSTCITTASTGVATCDGNGDGAIGTTSTSMAYEYTRAWQHLANAGMVAGTFTGIIDTCGGWCITLGKNAPRSRYQSGGWDILTVPSAWSGDTNWFPRNYGTVLVFGGQSSNTAMLAALLTTSDALNIDTKMDDGQPTTGTITPFKPTNFPNCTNGTSYTLTYTGAACSLIFSTGY